MAIEEILKAGNYHLIDVREPLELEMDGSIAEANNIPLGDIEAHIDEIKALDGNVIFFCRSGNRSGKATEFYKSQGFDNVYNGGGYNDLSQTLENLYRYFYPNPTGSKLDSIKKEKREIFPAFLVFTP